VGVTANPNINGVFGFEQGFDLYVDSRVVWSWMRPEPGQLTRNRATALPDARTILGDMLEHARARAEAPDRKPTYMQITLMDVHEGWRLVRPEFRKDDRGRVGVPGGYWDAVRQVSHDIGAFVEALGALPGWGNTLFVITSDHGQGLDDHPEVERSWGHGRLLYGSQVDVPVILYHPAPADSGPWSRLVSALTGRRRGLAPRTVETPVRLLDVAPTILDLVGVAPPAGAEGRSLRRLVADGRDPAVDLPGYFVSETHYQGVNKIAVHTPAWTYIENRDGQQGLNPRELQPRGIRENGKLTDRIDDEPEVAGELAAFLADWEGRHPERPATQPSGEVSLEELEQLEALGYIE
jgi:arylsulfatase A-like enzyme